MENNYNSSGGIGFVGLLQLVFITLKLLKVITWSWLWVLSPTWISIIIVAIIFLGLFVSFYKRNRGK